MFDLHKSDLLTSSTTEKVNDSAAVVLNIPAEKPETIKAVWLKAGTDFVYANQSEQAVKNSIDTICDDIMDLGFNTVFISCTDDMNGITLNYDSFQFDILDYCLKALNRRSLYSVISIEPKNTLSMQGYNDFCSKIVSFIDKYEAGSYLFPNHSELFSKNITESDKYSVLNSLKELRKEFLYGNFIFQAPYEYAEDVKGKDYFNFVSELMSDSIIQDIYVEPETSFNSKNVNFQKNLEKWRAITLENNCGLTVGQRCDLIGILPDFKSAEEIVYQVTACDGLDKNIGTSFLSYIILKNKDIPGMDVLLEYLKGNAGAVNGLREFTIDNHDSTEISTNESKITFRGGGSPNYPITCNGKTLTCTTAGDFSVEYKLNLGNNKFVFEHKGKTYTYAVKYTIDLIKQVKPKGTVNAPGGTVIDIEAVALKGSSVYAMINGTKVSMKQGGASSDSEDEDETPNYGSDFVSFYGKYALPKGKASKQSLGKIKVYALYMNISETSEGASVLVNAAQVVKPTLPSTTKQSTTIPTTTKPTTTKPTTTKPTTTNPPTSGTTEREITTEKTTPTEPISTPKPQAMVTPYSYAGVAGKSMMCEYKYSYTDTMLMTPFNNNSNPLSSPQLAGTFDYIVGQSSYGNYSYYDLASGFRVNVNDVKLISSGYNLPQNRIVVMSSLTNGSTNIRLSFKWKVPYNVKLNDQNYGQYYNDKVFGVTGSTATSVDFIFNYTSTADGIVDVSGSNIIKSAQWINDFSTQTTKLRLTLKQRGVFYGYSASYNSDGTLNIKIKNKPSDSLSGYTIMLDPGHGGSDPGAIGVVSSSQKYESQIVLSIAQKVRSILEANGARVIMTRTTDSLVTLDQRVAMIRKDNPDMFISIHCDSVDSSTPMGTSAFYYKAYSYPLANAIHEQLVSVYKNDIYKDGPSSQLNSVDRHTQYYAYKVTRVEECPAVLIEYGFVSNITECKVLQSASSQAKLAQATVNGIINYINNN
jgi:N-acetylmuramoyl-L-alanine amidase